MGKKEKATKEQVAAAKKEEKKDSGTKTIRCHCVSAFQDQTYGLGRRLANIGKNKATCTVCGKEHSNFGK